VVDRSTVRSPKFGSAVKNEEKRQGEGLFAKETAGRTERRFFLTALKDQAISKLLDQEARTFSLNFLVVSLSV
jgi:hypothetical protein